MHHIVVLRDPDGTNDGAYTIDFSPAEYDNPQTLKNLLLGRDVAGEIRARWIPSKNFSFSCQRCNLSRDKMLDIFFI